MRRLIPRAAASNTKILIIVLVCVGVAGLLGCLACFGLGFWAVKTATKEIEASQAAADSFFDQLKANQIQQAYQSTSADFKNQQTLVQFTAFVAANPILTQHTTRTMGGGFNVSAVNNVKTATLPYTLSGPTGNTTCTVTLTDSGTGWQVSKLDLPLAPLAPK
jgi:hypothetical protein